MIDDDKKQELFLKGIELFNNKEFYDAHEYWEKLWLEYQLDDKKFIQGLIQLTVAYYHLSAGNAKGALSLLNKSLDKMKLFLPGNRGLDVARIIDAMHLSINMIDKEKEFDWDIVPRLDTHD